MADVDEHTMSRFAAIWRRRNAGISPLRIAEKRDASVEMTVSFEKEKNS